MMEGVSSAMIYYVTFVNVTMYPQYNTVIRKNKKEAPFFGQMQTLAMPRAR
jgi:hypothetical protein